MANPKKAEVPLTMNAKVYALVFDMNAMAELEEDFGQPIHKFIQEFSGRLGISMIRKLLFHGLQLKHPEFTNKKMVGALMDAEDLAGYGVAIGRALSLGVGGKEPVEKENRKSEEDGDEDPLPASPPQPGTGIDSSP